MTHPPSAHQMVRVSVEVRKHAVVRCVRITAESIECALSIAGKGRPEHEVRLIFPVEAERFFAGKKDADESVETLPTGASDRRTRVAA